MTRAPLPIGDCEYQRTGDRISIMETVERNVSRQVSCGPAVAMGKAGSSPHGRDCQSFDELVSRQREALRQRVGALRSSVQQFGERCRRYHHPVVEAGPGGLPVPRTGRQRSESDFPRANSISSDPLEVEPVITASQFARDWPTTSDESDTDESVIEFCPASRKARQSRGCQTRPVGGRQPRTDCRRATVSHASTQTSPSGGGEAELALGLILSACAGDKALFQRLLESVEVLASRRRPEGSKNGVHRPSVTSTDAGPGSPRTVKTPNHNGSLGSSCFTTNARRRGKPLPTPKGSPRDSNHHACPGRQHNQVRQRRNAKRTDNNHRTDASPPPTVYLSLEEVLLSRLLCSEGEPCGGFHDTSTSSGGGEDGDPSDLHAEDDLWRLAEEGRLAWPTTDPVGRDSPGADPCPVRLLYRDETASSRGPFRVYRRRLPRRRQLPVGGRISVPPFLGVILEQS